MTEHASYVIFEFGAPTYLLMHANNKIYFEEWRKKEKSVTKTENRIY